MTSTRLRAKLALLAMLTVILFTPLNALALVSEASSDRSRLLGAALVGLAIVLCIVVFRKRIQSFFRLLFALVVDILFGLFSFSAILLAGYLIHSYAANKAQGPSVHILQYAASGLFVLSFVAGIIMFIRAVLKFARGLF